MLFPETWGVTCDLGASRKTLGLWRWSPWWQVSSCSRTAGGGDASHFRFGMQVSALPPVPVHLAVRVSGLLKAVLTVPQASPPLILSLQPLVLGSGPRC